MLHSRSHFADKENAHSTSLYQKTPARGLSAARDANLGGSKTAGRPGKAGGLDDLKLTMTTRTGKGKEKMQCGGGGGPGKGGEEEGIEPKRLFTNISSKETNPGTVKKSLPTSKSLTFHSSLDFKDVTNASSSSLAPSGPSAGQKTPHLKKTAAPSAGRLKTPGPTVGGPPPMATPLPSATRARRRSKQMHTPLPSAGMAMSTPEGKGGMAADLSFEMEDGGVESMLALGEVQEGVEFDDEAEVEYMPPTAYIEPFSLPYEVTSAKVLGDHIRSLPPLVFWPTDDEDAVLPEIQLDETACFGKMGERPDWTVQLKSIDSDDDLDLGLPKKVKTAPKPSPSAALLPAPSTAARRPSTLINGVRAAPSPSAQSRQPLTATKKPTLPSSTTRPLSKPSSAARAPAPSSSTPAIAPRKGLSVTKPSTLATRLPSSTNPNIKSSAPVSSSNAILKPTRVSTAISKPSSVPPTTASVRRPTATSARSTSTSTSRPSIISRPTPSASLRAPVPRDFAAEKKRREEEAKEVLRGLDEFESGLGGGVGLVGDDVAFEIEE